MTKPLGWRHEPARHALAAKGVSTRFMQARLARVNTGGVGFAIGRRSAYARSLKRIAKGCSSPPTEISESDYEAIVDPLFCTLAESDELVDRGDLGHARDRLNTAFDQYAVMEQTLPVVTDIDANDFRAAADMITRKILERSRSEISLRNQEIVTSVTKEQVKD